MRVAVIEAAPYDSSDDDLRAIANEFGSEVEPGAVAEQFPASVGGFGLVVLAPTGAVYWRYLGDDDVDTSITLSDADGSCPK
jgi:hypothetical protein